jgi:hypothetical protein
MKHEELARRPLTATYRGGYNSSMPAPSRYAGVPGFDLSTDDAPTPSIPKPAPETVTLRGVRVPLASDVGYAFLTDLCRNKERLFSDQQVCEKFVEAGGRS